MLRWRLFGPPAAMKTIKKMLTAKGPPKDKGKLVTRMKMGPRCFRVCSLAASEAVVLLAGYLLEVSDRIHDPMIPTILSTCAEAHYATRDCWRC